MSEGPHPAVLVTNGGHVRKDAASQSFDPAHAESTMVGQTEDTTAQTDDA